MQPKTVVCGNFVPRFLTLTEDFPCFFLSFKANARVKLAKTWHGPHSSTLVVIRVVLLLFVLFYVLFLCKCVLSPGDNPPAVNTLRTGSFKLFKLFKRPFPGFLTIFNPLNAELNPICYLLALLAHHFLHVSRIINPQATNVIYIYIYKYIYMTLVA